MPSGFDNPEALRVLQEGEMAIEGQLLRGSNYTFFGHASLMDKKTPFVYKPSRGERPLWDFPTRSLAKREAAAYLVSEGLRWGLVPPTVYRRNAPLGAGSMQLFIAHFKDRHYFNLEPEDIQKLLPFAAFDIIANNADRKGGHVLKGIDGRLFSIDHGLCFHREYKLRTVIWDFVGEPLPANLRADLEAFTGLLEPGRELHAALRGLLQVGEIKAMRKRALRLLAEGVFPPPPTTDRPFPWPPV